jgi:hypothetical protein
MSETRQRQDSPDRYAVIPADLNLIASTIALLESVTQSARATAPQKAGLKKVIRILKAIPEAAPEGTISIELVSPRRWLGDREVFHWWNVHIEDCCLHVSSGGHLFRRQTGCETFFSFTWDAAPGLPSRYRREANGLSFKDDALNYDKETDLIHLSEPGYRISVHTAVETEANRKGGEKSLPTAANGQSQFSCDLCGRALPNHVIKAGDSSASGPAPFKIAPEPARRWRTKLAAPAASPLRKHSLPHMR